MKSILFDKICKNDVVPQIKTGFRLCLEIMKDSD